jgi:hypothetical protein
VLHCPNCGHEHRWEYVPAAALNDARAIVERAHLLLVSGTVGPIPGVEPSMTVRFANDDWADLVKALGAKR